MAAAALVSFEAASLGGKQPFELLRVHEYKLLHRNVEVNINVEQSSHCRRSRPAPPLAGKAGRARAGGPVRPFPDTAKIVLVQDNLNIHKPASLYEAFPAPEARRLVERFEWHYTPKHGSWLDLAESELGVLASQCLDRRIADKQILAHEVTAARECGSSRPDWPNHGKDDATMKRTAKGKPKIDWSRVDAMTEAERHAAAMADPDARPMTDAEWARAPRVSQVSIIRRALKLSQEQFATTFHIPIGTIRDWEQGRYEPDAAARAYLRVIAREPNTVRRALGARTKPSP